MTLPNYLSLFRIIITPAIIYLLSVKKFTHALVIFIFAIISDGVDGYLARKYHRITDLGRFLDPFADKFLLVSIFNALAVLGKMPLWLFIVIFTKEITMFAGWVAIHFITKEIKIRPNIYGKTASVLLMLLVLCTLSDNFKYTPVKLFSYLKTVLLYSSLVFIAISFFTYALYGLKQIKLHMSK